MATRPVILVTGRHRPHEQLLLGYSALLGMAYLVGTPAPGSITALLAPTFIAVWAAALLVSGVSGLWGCWWHGERGLLLELGGLLINTGAMCLYATAAFTVAGWRALLPAGIVSAWCVANLVRTAQIGKELQAIRGRP